MTVNQKNIYGTYVINREMFKGKNADWQYNHLSFKITQNNDFILYRYNDSGEISKTITGKVRFIKMGKSTRIKIDFPKDFDVIESEPTLYRNIWDFYYVFYSPYYGNMFFEKGKWKFKNNEEYE